MQVWTSKTSDIVRCLLKREAVPAAQWPRMRDGAFAPALAPYSTPEDIEAFAVRLLLLPAPRARVLLWRR